MLLGFAFILAFLALPLVSLAIWFWRRSRREPIHFAEPFEIGRVMSRTFSVLHPESLPLAILGLIAIGLPAVVAALATRAQYQLDPGRPFVFTGMNGNQIAGYFGFAFAAGAAQTFFNLAFYIAAIDFFAARFEDRERSFARSLGAVPGRFLPVLAATVLLAIALIVGWVLFVWPAVLWGLTWSVAIPAIIVERAGPLEGLGRSRRLTVGSRGRILLAVILLIIVGVILGIPMSLVSRTFDTMSFSVEVVLQVILGVIGGLLNAGFAAAVYVELRQVREGRGAPELERIFA